MGAFDELIKTHRSPATLSIQKPILEELKPGRIVHKRSLDSAHHSILQSHQELKLKRVTREAKQPIDPAHDQPAHQSICNQSLAGNPSFFTSTLEEFCNPQRNKTCHLHAAATHEFNQTRSGQARSQR
ncbi:hypothetical protein Droror1_Dr00000529 [Drosera rotundifolia]